MSWVVGGVKNVKRIIFRRFDTDLDQGGLLCWRFHELIGLSEAFRVYHAFQHGNIARGLSTHKFSHLTKPTSKLPVPNEMGQKRSKNKCQ
ncbi:hypothetical protein LXL04_032143 [Taraxacum kok-saghyz]